MGLLLDAPQPLQTTGPQPGGRTFDRSGLEIDNCAQMGADRDGKMSMVAMQPQLSFPGPERGSQKISLTGINFVDDMLADSSRRPTRSRDRTCQRSSTPTALH